MKIHPPTVSVDENDPFKEALFGRKVFAESLTELLRNISESLVIVAHAPWGEGKTTFARMWRAELTRQKLSVIYFDAYAADYFHDPFVSFSGEILELAEKRLSEGKGLIERREFKKTAVEVGKRLAGLAAKVAIKSATLGALEETHIKELKDIGAEFATGIAEIGAGTIEKKIEHYVAERDSLAHFKKSLAKLAGLVREEQGFPLTIMVDELDRCRPDFALALLERVKHLFDVENVAFVLLVNRDQIESYIKKIYGDVDARAYLLKFANLFVDIPHQGSEYQFNYERGRRDYCHILFAHYGFEEKVREATFLQQTLGVLSEHFAMTLREIEKVFTVLALYYSSLRYRHASNEFLIATLAILKVKRPELYQRLRAGVVSLNAFFADTALDQIENPNQEGFDLDWTKKLFWVCLASDAEYEAAVNAEKQAKDLRTSLPEVRNLFRGERGKIIPLLCSHLDRFALKP
jgi:hypothetical protein